MPYGHPLYGIFWGYTFANMGVGVVRIVCIGTPLSHLLGVFSTVFFVWPSAPPFGNLEKAATVTCGLTCYTGAAPPNPQKCSWGCGTCVAGQATRNATVHFTKA